MRVASEPNAEEAAPVVAASPWRLAWRRLRRNRVALAFGGLFVLIVLFSLAAPLWADQIAETGPNDTHPLEKVEVDGEKREVVDPSGQQSGRSGSTPAGTTSSAPTAASAATRWCGSCTAGAHRC